MLQRQRAARRARNVALRRSLSAVVLTPSPCERRLRVWIRAGVPTTMRRSLSTPPSLGALDDLGDQDMAPPTQPGPSVLPRVHGVTEGLPNGSDV